MGRDFSFQIAGDGDEFGEPHHLMDLPPVSLSRHNDCIDGTREYTHRELCAELLLAAQELVDAAGREDQRKCEDLMEKILVHALVGTWTSPGDSALVRYE